MLQLLKSATIVDKRSPFHGKKRDILLKKGKIEEIKSKIEVPDAKVISYSNLHVSPSWVDTFATLPDPGFEYKETLKSGLAAAKKGGFGTVICTPHANPIRDNKTAIEYALNATRTNAVKLLPMGAISQGTDGAQLAEMIDMHQNGAVAFGDGYRSVAQSEMMSRALEYAKNFDGLVVSFPFDQGVNPGGTMHESEWSVQLGLKGIPSVAEEIRLARDIELLRYTGGRMHVAVISTAGSVALIKKAKQDGLRISCGIAAHQLSFLDEDLAEFDTRLKVLPPFRGKDDQKALLKGLVDGTIDVVCSDHRPEDIEHKKMEFDHANFGINGLETAFSAIRTATLKKLEIGELIEKLSSNGASLFGIDSEPIAQGAAAKLTLFDPDATVTFRTEKMVSLSKNNPFGGKTLTGVVFGVL